MKNGTKRYEKRSERFQSERRTCDCNRTSAAAEAGGREGSADISGAVFARHQRLLLSQHIYEFVSAAYIMREVLRENAPGRDQYALGRGQHALGSALAAHAHCVQQRNRKVQAGAPADRGANLAPVTKEERRIRKKNSTRRKSRMRRRKPRMEENAE